MITEKHKQSLQLFYPFRKLKKMKNPNLTAEPKASFMYIARRKC